jgi:DNA invertase Pin-like site-specific DNA recombinase
MVTTSKIGRVHLERAALVYIRQSTLAQVRDNTESTARQYAQAEEAARLGWEASKIVVIDDDLGVSGRTASGREGFKRLVTKVCMGEVGAVFGLEVSRLARSSADLQRLLEFCSLTDTLIVDADGVYDLQHFNDRLLLGLKGTMSEAELHILAGRLDESKRAAAARGELRISLPVGYLYDEDGQTVIDPDEEIRTAIADVFSTFERTGSAYSVVSAFVGRPFPSRTSGGAWAGEVHWGRLTHGRVLQILYNPTYAGAYVYGRSRSRRAVLADGTICTRTRPVAQEEWPVLIHDHHPGYIGWEAFLSDRRRLAANNTQRGARPPREGACLLQGIVLCGSCGRPMATTYSRGPSYECGHSRADCVVTPHCRSVDAIQVDTAVAKRLLAVVAPDEIAVALAAADEVADRRRQSTRALELTVERARYQAARAERAFHQCEPENRLVARSLERRWELKLAALAEAEAALATAQMQVAPLPPREVLAALARDLPCLWAAPSTSPRDRKRLLRTLVADVTLTSQAGANTVRIGIRWRAGAVEELTILRPALLYQHHRTDHAAVEMVDQMAGTGTPDPEIVAALNAAGLKTGVGRPFDVRAVRWLRYSHHLPPTPDTPPLPDEATAAAVAEWCDVGESVVYYWLYRGFLQGRHMRSGRWYIPFSPQVQAKCREMVARSSRIGRNFKAG